MFCVKCGKELAVGTKFCQNCGTPVPQSNNVDNTNNSTGNVEKKTAPAFANIAQEENKPDVFEVPVKPAKDNNKTVFAAAVPDEAVRPVSNEGTDNVPVMHQTAQNAGMNNTPVMQPGEIDNMNNMPVMEQPVNIMMAPEQEKKKGGAGVVILSAIITLVVLLAATGAGVTAYNMLKTADDVLEEDEKESKRQKKDKESEDTDDEGDDSEDEEEVEADKSAKADDKRKKEATTDTAETATTDAATTDATQTVEEETSPKAVETVKTALYTVRVSTTDGYANFRSTPEKTNNIIQEVYVGELMDIYGSDGQWLEAEYNGEFGWIHNTQVAEVLTYENGEEYKALCPWSSIESITDNRTVNILKKNADEKYQLNYPTSRTFEQMIINEIYARHGYMFKDDELQAYFSSQPWYSPVTQDMNAIGKTLNQIEKDNIKFLQ